MSNFFLTLLVVEWDGIGYTLYFVSSTIISLVQKAAPRVVVVGSASQVLEVIK